MLLLNWAAEAFEWGIALAWLVRASTTLYHLREVPDLLAARYASLVESGEFDGSGNAPDEGSVARPQLAVIVPALNEAEAIRACLLSLLASQGVRLEVIAVDDRSTDATGAIMDTLAAAHLKHTHSGHSLTVLHVTGLPEGWLGKPHALGLGAAHTTAPCLLFTDADAFYRPDALARAMRFMEQEQADHLVLLPTPILNDGGERMMLGMMQVLAIWAVRLWKIADPQARDSVGVGCFNLLRREAYEGIGGMSALRMEVLEDLRLGYLVKRAGFRQRAAFGPGLLCLHWADGALGIVHGLTKNFFAICRYRPVMMAGAVAATASITLVPVLGLLLGPARLPSLLSLLLLAVLYQRNAERTGISAWYLALFPVASCLFLYAMTRSAVVTLVRRGVSWRGTFYPLAELRRNAGPLR